MTATSHGYKFDFDSTEPMPAHDPEPSLFNRMAPTLIDYMLAWDVVFLGAVAIKWMYNGGYTKFISWFMRWAPDLYIMTTTGQMGG